MEEKKKEMTEKKVRHPIKKTDPKKVKVKKILEKRGKSETQGLVAPHRLKLLITVVERSKTEFYLDVLENYEVNMQSVIYGRGTAPTGFEYLGFGEQGKAIILSVVKESRVQEICAELEDKFHRVKNGKGIAYTIPISSVIGVLVYQFLSNNQDQLKKGN